MTGFDWKWQGGQWWFLLANVPAARVKQDMPGIFRAYTAHQQPMSFVTEREAMDWAEKRTAEWLKQVSKNG